MHIYVHICSTKSKDGDIPTGGSGSSSFADQIDTPTAYGGVDVDGGYVHAQDEELPYQGRSLHLRSLHLRIVVIEDCIAEMVLSTLSALHHSTLHYTTLQWLAKWSELPVGKS